ncbi:MAG: metallophosphoesterase family protein [Oscillospiraceae bacterium]|nr:metallophosphoesterase family protein [Oscillospiraceae bacterium]
MRNLAQNPLKFSAGGTLTVMQVTDIHGVSKPVPDTMRLIEGALDRVKPDLVVFTGDQIKGYSPSYMYGDKTQKGETAIRAICEPVDRRGIPFMATFGNHDPQLSIPLDQQMEIYKSFNHFVYPANSEDIHDAGTYSVPIMSADGATQAFNIYMVDSRGGAKGGGYLPVDREQIEWYKRVRDRLFEKNGRYIPSFVFQHIPVPEIYNLLESVDKKTEGAVKAFRLHKGKYFVLRDDIKESGGVMYEYPAIPDENTGEFEAVSEKGDVVGMFFGHDHKNSFVGGYNGVDMGYCPGVGFGEYGNGVERGVRVFEVSESDPRGYTSRALTYRELFGKKVLNVFRKKFYDYVPSSVDAAIPLIGKALGFMALIAAVIILLIKFGRF